MDPSAAKIASDRNLPFVARQMALHANVSRGGIRGGRDERSCSPQRAHLFPPPRWRHRCTTVAPTPPTSTRPSGLPGSATSSGSVNG